MEFDVCSSDLPPRGDNLRGYIGIEENALSYSMGDDTPPDLFERYTAGRPDVPDDAFHNARRETLFQPNVWPAALPPAGAIAGAYFREMERLTADLLRIFAVALGIDEDFFAAKITRHRSEARRVGKECVCECRQRGSREQ